MRPLPILILSDGRPGHYHLSEGVAAAIGRRRPIDVRRATIARRAVVPGRVLAGVLSLGMPPGVALRAGYGADASSWKSAELIISAGGDTLAANVAAARLLRATNIFCGTLRHLPAEDFNLVISSYARHASLPHHLVTLKPNGIDPDTLGRHPEPDADTRSVEDRPLGLLVGGPSGLFHWRDDEWRRLAEFLGDSHRALGKRWVVSTSRRTPDAMADRLQALARQPNTPIAELIDFRVAGPGTLPQLFSAVSAILVTEDSSTMLSEAVCARLPVIGVAPEHHAYKDEEQEYRAYMMGQGWCRGVPLAGLTPDAFAAALAKVQPLRENHLDRLAAQLAERLPALFADIGS